MALKSVFFTLLSLLFSAALSPSYAQHKSREQLKTELIQKAIRHAVTEHRDLPTFSMVKNKKKIFVLDQMKSISYPDSVPEFLTKAMLPDLGKTKLVLLQEQDLPPYHLKKNDLYYIEIGRIDILTDQAAVVDIGGIWILGKHSRKGGLRQRDAGGYSLLFKLEGENWSEGKIIRTFLK